MSTIIDGIETVQGDNVTFYIRGNKVAIGTRWQFLIVEPYNQYFTTRLNNSVNGIKCGRIRTVNELIEDCSGMIRLSNSTRRWYYETWSKK